MTYSFYNDVHNLGIQLKIACFITINSTNQKSKYTEPTLVQLIPSDRAFTFFLEGAQFKIII